jgi:related to thiamin biosynthesis protein (thiF)
MTEEERIRYARMIAIPEIGMKGVEKLKKSHVFITGCGALGSVVAMYLAGAGVGKITIADFDTIDISNLQRQLFYATSDAGKSKAHTLAKRLSALNPECDIECIDSIITETSAPALFSQCDFIIDATDNPTSKFVTDKICHELGKPCCIGGVAGFTGQVMSWSPGHVGYSDIFCPESVDSGFTPCSIGGVLGPAAGVIACCQASETIKHLTDAGEMLFDKVFFIDLLTMQTRLIEVA